MAAYCRVHDSRHLQADCQELGSAPEPYALESSMGCLYLFTVYRAPTHSNVQRGNSQHMREQPLTLNPNQGADGRNGERKYADTIGTVPVSSAAHFQC